MIYAKGTKNGQPLELTAEKKRGEWYFYFNGKLDAKLESELLQKMETPHPFGGMRAPKNEEERLAAVLEGYFFDRAPDEVVLPFSLPESEEGEVDGR